MFNKVYLIVILLLLIPCSHSSTFHILLESGNGAPTPQQAVQEAQLNPPPPAFAISAFNVEAPQNVQYFIKKRATGHLRNIMDMSPNWAATELQQYLIVEYTENVDVSNVLSSYANDSNILFGYEVTDESLPKLHVPSPDFSIGKMNKTKPIEFKQNANSINGTPLSSIWDLSEGMGYVGIVDVGLQTNHRDLRAFDGTTYVGGNLLDYLYQIDIAESGVNATDINVDTLEPISSVGRENCDFTDGDPNNGLTVGSFAGHGTHAAGLIAAKGNTAPGICKNCGLASAKFTSVKLGGCTLYGSNYYLTTGQTSSSWVEGWYHMALLGVGTLNVSSGNHRRDSEFCANFPNNAACKALQLIDEHQILLAASSGNNREDLNFPANDSRMNSASGVDQSGNFWNESPNNGDYTNPNNSSNCPQYPANADFSLSLGDECGSNYSHPSESAKTDSVTLSRNVYSIFYEGQEHNAYLPNACTDAFDGIPDDGYGLCSGTSMSAPQVTGYLQLMRSTIPLLPNGSQDPDDLTGIRNVFNATSSRYISGQGYSDFYGFGEPNPRLALETILGKSNGVQMKTRLTPMFELVSSVEKNNAYTPFPQIAMAYLMNSGAEYISNISAPLIDEFTEFWYDESVINFPTEPVPRASFYVFTTNNNPFTGTKNLTPLRRMEKTVDGSRNDTYAIDTDEIQNLHAADYNYAGIEGYILPNCTQEPACIPTGAQKLYRVFDTVDFNHKLINLPTNSPAPANSTKIGYVYPNIDTDGDGLIDGQERILGTSINAQDSDGDTIPDGVEYPAAGVPYSDPMISDIIFKNGFE